MEIERKYLVSALPQQVLACEHVDMEQCYITTSPTIRIRKVGDVCLMTYKRPHGSHSGAICNTEIEFSIPMDAYAALREERCSGVVHKTRYYYPLASMPGLVAEVDLFHGRYEGLQLVEVEFPSETAAAAFQAPEWFGQEVSGDARYRNSSLAAGVEF